MHRNTLPSTWFRAYTSLGARTTIDSVDDGKQLQDMRGGFMKGESRMIVESPSMDFAKKARMRASRPAHNRATLDLPIAVRAIATGILYLLLLLIRDRISYPTPFTAVTDWSLYLLGSTLIVWGIAREVASS
jgi:hypothetical protein